MSSLNKVILIGRLGKDPEYKENVGTGLCSFSIATGESYTDKDGKRVEKTEWHNIKVWGKVAELCSRYLSKGRLVCVEGKLQTTSYEKDGIKRYSTDIVASNVSFLSSKGEGGESKKEEDFGIGYVNKDEAQGAAHDTYNLDDIPF